MNEKMHISPEAQSEQALNSLLMTAISKDTDGDYSVNAIISRGNEYLNSVGVDLPISSSGKTALQRVGGERVFTDNQNAPADLLTIVVSEAAFRHGSRLTVEQAQAHYERVSSALSREAISTSNHYLRHRFATETSLRARLIMAAQLDNPNLTHTDDRHQQRLYKTLFDESWSDSVRAMMGTEPHAGESSNRERLRRIGYGLLGALGTLSALNPMMWGGHTGMHGQNGRSVDRDPDDPDDPYRSW